MGTPNAPPTEVKETFFKCEGCGATLTYAPGTTFLKCEYCGREHKLEIAGGMIKEHDISEFELVPHTNLHGYGVPSRQFKCDRCGAVTALPGMVTASECAFCGSDIVVETAPVDGMIMPESLVPFMFDKNNASQRFKGWLKGLWFRPGDLKKKAALAKIDGVYVPHFTFDANVFSRWSGWRGKYYYETEYYTDSQGRRQSRQVRHTRWYFRTGTHSAFYNDELVCASKGLPENILDKIYPFQLAALRHYKPEYLSGFAAEAYTVDPRACWMIGKDQMYDKERRACSQLLNGDTQRGLTVHSEYSNITWKHILLPVFVAAYAYGRKTYRFMVNGQSGEVQGEAPYSWWKIAGAICGVVAIVVSIIGIGKLAGWF
jgi:DNA-directed RNA polymerase subunit RPC12/RpoP